MYLLSTQALLDALSMLPSIQAWLTETPITSLHLSTITLAQAQQTIGRVNHAGDRGGLEDAFRRFEALIAAQRGIETFERSTARVWARLADQDLWIDGPSGTVRLSETSRMVVATAIERDFFLVERPQPYHRALARLRIQHY